MKKKVLSVFLSFCMIVSCMVGISVTAGADNIEIEKLWIGNSDEITFSCDVGDVGQTSGTAKVYTTSDSVVVELNNFQYSGTGCIQMGTYSPFHYHGTAPLTIILKGTNIITTDSLNEYYNSCLYIGPSSGYVNVNIKGGGSLTATNGDAQSSADAIYVYGNLTISDCTITATSGNDNNNNNNESSEGIFAFVTLTINNAEINATGYDHGIASKIVNFISGELIAYSENGAALYYRYENYRTTISLAEGSGLISAKAGVNADSAAELENGLADITDQNYVHVTVSTFVKFPAVAATCIKDGNKEYYTSDGKYYIKDETGYTETTLDEVTIPALGHDYKETVIKEVTCTEDGEYEFRCTRCDSSYKSCPKARGHRWGTPKYVWADDLSACSGTSVCKRDETHTAEETVNTTSEVTKAATCTRNGSATYTAEFTNEAFKTQTKTADIPALGHDRGENGVCKRCGDSPSRGPSGDTTPTTPAPESPDLELDGEVVYGTPNRFAWKPIPDAKSYSLWLNFGGKPVFLQEQTETFAEFVYGIGDKLYLRNGDVFDVLIPKDGKFVKTGTLSADKIDTVKVKNNVTNEFVVKCRSGGKTSELKVSVKTYYKPAPTVKAKTNGALLKWESVDSATKYRLSKMVNGKLKKVADVNGTSINLTGLKSGKTYTYVVKALVNNEWTTVWKADLVTVTAK